MTTLLPGRSRDSVVKGLAMLGSRLRHDRKVKCVDAGPGSSVRAGRLLPNDGAHGRRGDDLRRWYVEDATADIGRLSPFPAAAPPLTFSVGRCREFFTAPAESDSASDDPPIATRIVAIGLHRVVAGAYRPKAVKDRGCANGCSRQARRHRNGARLNGAGKDPRLAPTLVHAAGAGARVAQGAPGRGD